jgi:hypothetical protein
MADFVHPDIKQLRDSPEQGVMTTVVVVYEEGVDEDRVRTQANDCEGEIIDTLPDDIVVMRLPETSLEQLCGYSAVISVSPDDKKTVL